MVDRGQQAGLKTMPTLRDAVTKHIEEEEKGRKEGRGEGGVEGEALTGGAWVIKHEELHFVSSRKKKRGEKMKL